CAAEWPCQFQRRRRYGRIEHILPAYRNRCARQRTGHQAGTEKRTEWTPGRQRSVNNRELSQGQPDQDPLPGEQETATSTHPAGMLVLHYIPGSTAPFSLWPAPVD